MKRQTIKIDKYILSHIIERPYNEDTVEVDQKELSKYKLIEDTLIGFDEYDGGGSHKVIIERLSDNKFFTFDYEEWDIDWEKGGFDNFPEKLTEVFPKQITVTVYE